MHSVPPWPQPTLLFCCNAPNTEPFSEIYCLIVTFDQLLSTVNFQLILTPPPTPLLDCDLKPLDV